MYKPTHPVLVAPAVAVVVHHLASSESIPVVLLPKDCSTTFGRADVVVIPQLIGHLHAEGLDEKHEEHVGLVLIEGRFNDLLIHEINRFGCDELRNDIVRTLDVILFDLGVLMITT